MGTSAPCLSAETCRPKRLSPLPLGLRLGVSSHCGCQARFWTQSNKVTRFNSFADLPDSRMWYSDFSTGQQYASLPVWSRELTGEGGRSSPAHSESGFFHLRSATSEPQLDEMAVQDVNIKTNPLAGLSRGFGFVSGSGRCFLTYPEIFLRFTFEGVAN